MAVTGDTIRKLDRERMGFAFVDTEVEAKLIKACLTRPGRQVMVLPPCELDGQYMVYSREGGVGS